jgi:molecular chaperone DnaK
MARDNRTLGKFHLVGIPPAPRGVPQVEVTFDIDANGIVNVSAKDLGTGKEQKITITSSSGLNKEDIDKMVKDAESHADDDRRKQEEIETRNKSDSTVYQVEKALNENRSKISEADAKSVDEALADAKKALEEGGVDRMKKATDALNQASNKAFEAMYKGAGQQPPSGPSGAGGPGGPNDGAGSGSPGNGKAEGDVIDAEYVDADEKKKE